MRDPLFSRGSFGVNALLRLSDTDNIMDYIPIALHNQRETVFFGKF